MARVGEMTGAARAAHALFALALVVAPCAARAQDGAFPPVRAAESHEDSLRCLTLAVAYEAGNQPREGQEAVAEVVLNRMAHPAFPKSVCGVVFQGTERTTGCQFTFTCDGALRRRLSDRSIAVARRVAADVLDGAAPRHVAGALNYHADYVSPSWAPTLDRVARIGAHIFYRPAPGGVPVSGRGGDRDEPRHELISRVYAAYAASSGDAPSGPAPAASAQQDPVRVASARPFAPWGLGLR